MGRRPYNRTSSRARHSPRTKNRRRPPSGPEKSAKPRHPPIRLSRRRQLHRTPGRRAADLFNRHPQTAILRQPAPLPAVSSPPAPACSRHRTRLSIRASLPQAALSAPASQKRHEINIDRYCYFVAPEHSNDIFSGRWKYPPDSPHWRGERAGRFNAATEGCKATKVELLIIRPP